MAIKNIKNGQRLRFVYAPYQHSDSFADNNNSVYECPNCGGAIWEASINTGTGKLPKDQVKMKCVLCKQWFIGNKNNMERVLGAV